MKERFLFLDIDGVLNSAKWLFNHSADKTMLDRDAINRVNRIVKEAECKVVISSVWRLNPENKGKSNCPHTQMLLNEFGATFKIFGRTPDLYNKTRGKEIQKWLEDNKVTMDQIVILDDDSDMEHLSSRLVQTSWDEGIKDEHVDKVLLLFSGVL